MILSVPILHGDYSSPSKTGQQAAQQPDAPNWPQLTLGWLVLNLETPPSVLGFGSWASGIPKAQVRRPKYQAPLRPVDERGLLVVLQRIDSTAAPNDPRFIAACRWCSPSGLRRCWDKNCRSLASYCQPAAVPTGPVGAVPAVATATSVLLPLNGFVGTWPWKYGPK